MNILAAVDFSPASTILLNALPAWTSHLSGKLWLIHVAAPEPDFVGFEPGPVNVRAGVAKHVHEEHQELGREAAALRSKGLDVTPLLLQGPTVATILKEAAKLNIDLIIMGSDGHGAMHDLLMGSISRGVIQGAACPVLIIPNRPAVAAQAPPSA
ncbi:MAG: universal stress protein [Lentisphaerae bacterium]|nr:universal stress protein [Lentisphaerota bacterium]